MSRVAAATNAIGNAWDRFWFNPTSTSTLAVIRIAFGFLVLCWTISLGPDLMDFFSRSGIIPPLGNEGARWGILRIFPSDGAVIAVYVALLVASVLLMIGQWTRVAAVVVFLGIMSFERRNTFVFNSGDGLLRVLALYLALAPSGVALSLTRWRKAKERFWEFPLRAPWAVRLIQIQLSVLYVSTVWSKLRGSSWNDGTAVSYSMRIEDLVRFRTPSFITDSLLISNLMTFGTLAIEVSLGILVWNRRLRPWVLGLGILLHVSIALSVRVGFFTAALLVAYIAFVPTGSMERLLDRTRAGLGRSRWKSMRGLAQAGPAIAPDERSSALSAR
jgi:hypothetical protein